MGLTVDAFYDLTPVEFKYAIKALNDLEFDHYKTQWETARYTVFHIWNSAGKSLKGKGMRDVKDVNLFAWELEKDIIKLDRKQTIDEMKDKVLAIASAFGVKKKDKTKV